MVRVTAAWTGWQGASWAGVCMTRVRVVVMLAVWLAATLAGAQAPVDVHLGIRDGVVAGGWNALAVVTRNLPNATFTLVMEPSGGAFDGVAHTLVLPLGSGAGVQRRDVVVPVPSWREAAWRVTQGERIVVSGTRAARDRDDRPLDLLLTAVPSAWVPAWPDTRRVVVVTLDDLPRLDAAWRVVDTLIVDGSLPVPSDAVLVTAAVMGADVYLPVSVAGSLAARVPADGTPVLMGAGSLRILPVGVLDDEVVRRTVIDGALAGLVPAASLRDDPGHALVDVMELPGWRHRPRRLVVILVAAYVGVMGLLLRIPARDGLVAVVLVTVAAGAVSLLAAPGEATVETRDGVVLAASGLGVRFDVRHVASLAGGTIRGEGWQALRAMPPGIPAAVPSSIDWREDMTSVDVSRAGRVLLAAAPFVTSVPAIVDAEAVVLDDVVGRLPDGVVNHARAMGVVRVARHDEAWWLLRDGLGGAP